MYARVGIDIYRRHKELRSTNSLLSIKGTNNHTPTHPPEPDLHANAKASWLDTETAHVSHVEAQRVQSRAEQKSRMANNKALRSYFRYSFLFFIAMVVTWVRITSFGFYTHTFGC